jgi:hypothetical protein
MGNVEYVAPPLPYANFLRNIMGEDNAVAWPLNATSFALVNALVVKAGAGTLYGIGGFSNKGSSQFVQVFDSATLPADGAAPDFIFNVGATSNIGVFWGDVGRSFSRGIVVCNSSTAATKTIGSADCFFDCQYI